MGLMRTPPKRANGQPQTPRSGTRSQTRSQALAEQPTQSPSHQPTIAAPTLNAQAGPSASAPEAVVKSISTDTPEAAEPADAVEAGNMTTMSVTSSAAFIPRNPKVMRSPPSGPSVYPALPQPIQPIAPTPKAAAQSQDDTHYGEMSMEIDEPSTSTNRSSTPTRQTTTAVPLVTPASRPIRPARASQRPFPATPAADTSFAATTPGQIGFGLAGDRTENIISPVAARVTVNPIGDTATTKDAADIAAAGNGSAESADASMLEGASIANATVDDSMSMSNIPPPLDSPPRQSVSVPVAHAPKTPKQPVPPRTPGTKRKAPSDEQDPNDTTTFSFSQAQEREQEAAGSQEKTVQVGDEYGQRWKKSNDTLKMVTERVVKKWTAEDLKKSLPTLAEQDPRGIESIHRSAAHNLQNNIMVKAQKLFEHYRMGRSLQIIDQVVLEGDAYEKTRTSENARPDAWRSDLAPDALAAAMTLQMYDEAWTRLRSEYVDLHEDSRRRYASILSKQAQLKELEGSVSDGVVELEKTIKLLDGFPSEDMMAWVEDTLGRVGGGREA